MIDIDKVAHELALACASNYSACAPSQEQACKNMVNFYYQTYKLVKAELQLQIEFDESID